MKYLTAFLMLCAACGGSDRFERTDLRSAQDRADEVVLELTPDSTGPQRYPAPTSYVDVRVQTYPEANWEISLAHVQEARGGSWAPSDLQLNQVRAAADNDLGGSLIARTLTGIHVSAMHPLRFEATFVPVVNGAKGPPVTRTYCVGD